MPLRTIVAICLASIASAQDPPPQLGDHLEATCAVDRENVHHASIEGVVLDASGKGAGEPVAGARVYVYAQLPWYGPLAMAAATTDAEGRYRIDDIEAGGSLAVFATSPRGEPFASSWRSLGLASGRVAQLRPVTLPKAAEVATPHVFRGKLVGAGGKPVAGALFRLHHEGTFDPGAFATTDADGSFEVHCDLGTPKGGVLFVGNSKFELKHVAGAKDLDGTGGMFCDLDLVEERTIQAPSIVAVPLSAPDIEGATFYQVRGSRLVPCIGGVALLRHNEWDSGQTTVWVRAPGRLPRACSVPSQSFDFTGDQPRLMRVVDDRGDAVVAAMIDVCSAHPAARLAEMTLATFRTGEAGTLKVRGSAEDHVVYVYAAGHAPARALWRAGHPLEVVLTRCSAKLEVTAGETQSTLYVRRAGTFASCAKVYLREGVNTVALVPGDYELSVYGARDLEGAVSLAVAGDTQIALPTEDQRPELLLTVAKAVTGDACWAYASRSIVGGMITKWSIHTQRGGPMLRHEIVATVENLDAEPDANGARRFRLRLPTSGRSTVLAGNGDLGGGGVRFFRECVFEFGRKYELELPEPAGALRATVAKYPDDWDSPFRGVVGPRLCLEPAEATPWGVLVALPEPAKFQFAALQPGTFNLHHHLYETGILFSTEGTWGGAPITITKDAPGVAEMLARGPDAELAVEVSDSAGAPVAGRLAIRDRMFECWTDDLRQNTTLDDAADPIPTPPAAELVDGKCKLGKVRSGRIHFVLDLDEGARIHFARDVDVSKPLAVVLDVLPPPAK